MARALRFAPVLLVAFAAIAVLALLSSPFSSDTASAQSPTAVDLRIVTPAELQVRESWTFFRNPIRPWVDRAQCPQPDQLKGRCWEKHALGGQLRHHLHRVNEGETFTVTFELNSSGRDKWGIPTKGTLGSDLTFTVSIDGYAYGGSDMFQIQGGNQITIPAGQSSVSVQITAIDDAVHRPDMVNVARLRVVSMQGATLTVLPHWTTFSGGQHVAHNGAKIGVYDNDDPPQGGQNSPANPVPTVASPIGDVAHLQVGSSKSIPLSGVFAYDGHGALEIFAGTPDTDIATVSVAQDGSSLTVTGVAAGTATIEVVARDLYGEQAIDEFNVTVKESAPNSAPTVASAIDDATIANQSGTHNVSLSEVFDDADEDALTITAESSKTSVATVSVAADQTSLTVSAKKRGTCRFSSCPWLEGPANITVTAKDGNGGSVSDSFTVTVKSAPVVASALPDITGLEIGDTRTPSLSGVFSDADQDALTVTEVASSDTSKVSISTSMTTAADGSIVITGFTLTAMDSGTATITVTAQDSDGNSVSDAFDVTVNAPKQQKKANSAPTVASAIDDATIVKVGGTHQVTLSGVFSDEDTDDTLTIKAKSSKTSVATVSVASDGSTLTVTAKSRGTATITATASDGEDEVSDTFTIKVKAAPTVASAIADISSLTVEDWHDISVSNVFSDADSDTLTYTASSTDEDIVAAYVLLGNLTLLAIKPGTVTIKLTAEDSDGNSVSDSFDVTVTEVQQQVQEKEKQPQQQQQQTATLDLPGPVVSLEVTARTANSVTVSWTAPETGGAPKSYIVHLKPEDGEKGSGKTKKPKATKTQVTFKNLEPGRTYNIWARAQNQTGKGERTHTTITLP